ncbi:MAG: NADH-quinone oxidoreductase subunit L, partial [Proteobacteria bacterium]
VMLVPLVVLAVPSLLIGWFTIGPVLFGDFFEGSIFVRPEHDVLARIGETFHGPGGFVLHALQVPATYLSLLGVLAAWFLYIKRPELPQRIVEACGPVYRLLTNKFYVDEIYQAVFAGGARNLGRALWRVGDVAVIDGAAVNGSARVVGWMSGIVRRLQSGYLYHYAFTMIIGLAALLGWYVLR